MTDVPGKRVRGGALVFPLDYINKKGQGVTRSVLRTTPWTRWAPRAQTRFTYVSFLTRVGISASIGRILPLLLLPGKVTTIQK